MKTFKQYFALVVVMVICSAGYALAAEKSKADVIDREVLYIQGRNNIFRLSDQATANGDAKAFDQIVAVYQTAPDQNIKMTALSEMRRIKNYFEVLLNKQRVEVSYQDDGVTKTLYDKNIPTDMLLQGLKGAPAWEYRARIAELLKERKEKGVPDALMDALINDPHLKVREKALSSFAAVTGYSAGDTLSSGPVFEWWQENAAEVRGTLSELDTLAKLKEKEDQEEKEAAEKAE